MEGRFGGKVPIREGRFGGKVPMRDGRFGGKGREKGEVTTDGEGTVGVKSPHETPVQELAEAVHEATAFPSSEHEAQQVKVGQADWISLQASPVSAPVSPTEAHEAKHSGRLSEMHFKNALASSKQALAYGGKVSPKPPKIEGVAMDGVATDGEDWPSANACR